MTRNDDYVDIQISGSTSTGVEVNIWLSTDKLEELWEEEQFGQCWHGCGNHVAQDHKICITCLLEELVGYGTEIAEEVKEIFCE